MFFKNNADGYVPPPRNLGDAKIIRMRGNFGLMDWPTKEGRQGTPNGWRKGKEKVKGRCEDTVCPTEGSSSNLSVGSLQT